jgi:hypothetical protein
METVKLVEVTLVLAIETYSADNHDMVSGLDYIEITPEAHLIGWAERDMAISPVGKSGVAQ